MKKIAIAGVVVVLLFLFSLIPSRGSFVSAASTTDYMWINEYKITGFEQNMQWMSLYIRWINDELVVTNPYSQYSPYMREPNVYIKLDNKGNVLEREVFFSKFYPKVGIIRPYSWVAWTLNSGNVIQIYALDSTRAVTLPALHFVVREVDPNATWNSSVMWAKEVTISAPSQFVDPYNNLTYQNVSGISIYGDMILNNIHYPGDMYKRVSITDDNSGGAYISFVMMVAYSQGGEAYFPVVMRINSQGKVLWTKIYTTALFPGETYSIHDNKGNLYLGVGEGYFTTILKISPTGKLLWARNITGGSYGYFELAASPDSSKVFFGLLLEYQNEPHSFIQELYSLIFDEGGKVIANKIYLDENHTLMSTQYLFWNGITSTSAIWGEDGPIILQMYDVKIPETRRHTFLPGIVSFDEKGNLKELKAYNLNLSRRTVLLPLSLAKSPTGDVTLFTTNLTFSRDSTRSAVFDIFNLDPAGDIKCANCTILSMKLPQTSEHPLEIGTPALTETIPMNYSIQDVDPNSPIGAYGTFPSWWDSYWTVTRKQWCNATRLIQAKSPEKQTEQTPPYVTAGVVWYLRYNHYSKLFNETYGKLSAEQKNMTGVKNAIQMMENATKEYNLAESKGVVLLFPIQCIPYLRKAYLAMFGAYNLLMETVGES